MRRLVVRHGSRDAEVSGDRHRPERAQRGGHGRIVGGWRGAEHAEVDRPIAVGRAAGGARCASGPLRLTHVVTDLERGGAQQMLVDLLGALDPTRFASEVVSLAPAGPLAEPIEALGVPVCSLGLRRSRPNPWAVVRLASRLRQRRVDVVHGWLGHANLVAGLAVALVRRPPMIWGVHHTTLDPEAVPATTRWTLEACRRLAPWLPAWVVSCSESGARTLVADGYPAATMLVIPNGCNGARFRPDPASRPAVRRELGLPADAVLVGQSARFHPQKDHGTAIAAMAGLVARHPDVHVVLWGAGVTNDNPLLHEWIQSSGVGARCHLLGERADVSRLTAAMDIGTSSSAYGEACPLVLLESMASGIPCVATDVGDVGSIVGDTGIVVSPRKPAALAEAWSTLVDLGPEERARLGEAARRRALERFSLEAAVRAYEALYTRAAAGHGTGEPAAVAPA